MKEITGTLKKGFALSLNKIGGTSTIKTNGFVLYCLRFALSLHKIAYIIIGVEQNGMK